LLNQNKTLILILLLIFSHQRCTY